MMAVAASAVIGAWCVFILAAYALIEFMAWREWRSVRAHERMRRTLRGTPTDGTGVAES